MADTDYIFHISPYDTEKLLPQVSRALEKRTEMVSRERSRAMEAYRPIPLYGAGAEKEQATHKGNECVMSGGRHFSGCSRSDGAARAVRAAACRRGCHGCGYHWPVAEPRAQEESV